jgi:hypothetical protein
MRLWLKEEIAEAGEVVGIDEVDSGVSERGPAFGQVRVGPETDGAALFMGPADEFAEFHAFGFGERAVSPPLEMGLPVVADERDKARGGLGVEVDEPTVVAGEAYGLLFEVFPGAIAGDGYGDGIGRGAIGFEPGEHFGVGLKRAVEGLVCGERIAFDVDEEMESDARGVDAPAALTDSFEQGFEVERFERSFRAELRSVVGYQELILDEEDIGLDAAEAVVERIQERSFLEVIIVGMGLWQRDDRGGLGGSRVEGP